ncbi:hypothetical protein DOTSEDRAFT_41560 [Lecanosticta acicola]|uniref:BTB domain-containing protein n=1 Tax=Lecanosticta acicola TaxID=111012 RepID=A0AAI9EFW3_9PEZI|nr:hypothetical protein DOTSEDRAFT_41560 [Lecanosticta acicola]
MGDPQVTDSPPTSINTRTSPSTTTRTPKSTIKRTSNAHTHPVVYSRDFAYADNGPIVVVPTRMVRTDILTASAKTFAELLSGPTVDIFVGRERRQWSLHRNLLCHHSSYFETELYGHHDAPGKRSLRDNTLELPDDDPVGFELLVKWLYQGQLEDTSQLSDVAKYEYAVACHKLHLLCDKFNMVRLKNIAMDQYRQCLHESQLVPDAEEIDDIYGASPIDSPFRSLMIKIAARQVMDPDVDRDADAYRRCFENSSDFAVEMINAIRHMSGGILFEDPTCADQCTYHDHSDVSGCQTEGKGKGKSRAPRRVAHQATAGATKGQGPSTIQAQRGKDYVLGPMIAELPAEKPTPKKLSSARSSPTAARAVESHSPIPRRKTPSSRTKRPPANQSVARQPLHRANGTDGLDSQLHLVARDVPQKLESRKHPDHIQVTASVQGPRTARNVPLLYLTGPSDSPFDAAEQPYSAHEKGPLQMRAPKSIDNSENPHENSPLAVRDGSRVAQTGISGVGTHPSLILPTIGQENQSVGAAEKGHELTVEHVRLIPRQVRPRPRHGVHALQTRSTAGAGVDSHSAASSGSRKRKLEDRTPRIQKRAIINGSKDLRAVTTPCGYDEVQRRVYSRSSAGKSSAATSQAGSPSVSVASGGPRKLSRISSVKKQSIGSTGSVSVVDSRRVVGTEQKRRPQKLRRGSAQIRNGVP